MYTNHIVVIGAGASGLMAAISAAGRLRETASSTDVILLELDTSGIIIFG